MPPTPGSEEHKQQQRDLLEKQKQILEKQRLKLEAKGLEPQALPLTSSQYSIHNNDNNKQFITKTISFIRQKLMHIRTDMTLDKNL